MDKALRPDSWTWCYAMGRDGHRIHPKRTDLEFWAYTCGVVRRAQVERRKALGSRE